MKEERKEKEDFQGRFSRKRREREDFQGRCFKKEKRSEKRKKQIEKEQIPILWNQFRGLGFLSCRRNYS